MSAAVSSGALHTLGQSGILSSPADFVNRTLRCGFPMSGGILIKLRKDMPVLIDRQVHCIYIILNLSDRQQGNRTLPVYFEHRHRPEIMGQQRFALITG